MDQPKISRILRLIVLMSGNGDSTQQGSLDGRANGSE